MLRQLTFTLKEEISLEIERKVKQLYVYVNTLVYDTWIVDFGVQMDIVEAIMVNCSNYSMYARTDGK